MDLSSRTALELLFADNFETRLFAVLAEHYFKDGDLDRARKVCEIGLDYHPENVDGLFVLARMEQREGALKKAEQSFKSILKDGTVHLQAVLALAVVQFELERSDKTLYQTWKQVLKWDPSNEIALGHIKKLKPESRKKRVVRKKTKKVEKPKPDGAIEISSRLATFTMVTVLKNQGLYHQALSVLDVLDKKVADKDRISKEKNELLALMEN